jgi:hypothetical protein
VIVDLAKKIHDRQRARVLELDERLKKAGATRVRVSTRSGRIRAFAKTSSGIHVAGGDSIVEALLALLAHLTDERTEP